MSVGRCGANLLVLSIVERTWRRPWKENHCRKILQLLPGMNLHAQPVAVAGHLSIGTIPGKRVNADAQGRSPLFPTAQVAGVGFPGQWLMSVQATTICLVSVGGQISPLGQGVCEQELILETLLVRLTMIQPKACVERQAGEN